MKKYLFLLTILTISLPSCNGWLDITPENTVVESKLYEKSSGFHTSLNGLYRLMAREESYGKNLTYGFVEVLSQNYRSSSTTGITKNSYNYDVCRFIFDKNQNIKNVIDGIWSNAYEIIANANNLIQHTIIADTSIFRYSKLEKNLIHGEALAIRALLHFDMLRIFGTSKISDTGAPAIPYITKFPYYGGQPNESMSSILTKIEQDLLIAIEHIQAFESASETNLMNLVSPNRYVLGQSETTADIFYNLRGYRMNSLAANALLARVYNYGGKHKEASDYADFVIGYSVLVEGSIYKILSYATGDEVVTDKKFISDLIFSISDTKLYENYEDYAISNSSEYFILDKNKVEFGSRDADGGDYRKNLCDMTSNRGGYIPLKYVPTDAPEVTQNITKDMIPLFKLAEMHFIKAEYHASIEEYDLANQMINNVRMGRNCRFEDFGITDMDSFKEELFKEVRKEFFSEGQTFFYYKKYDVPLRSNLPLSRYIVPMPDSELIN